MWLCKLWHRWEYKDNVWNETEYVWARCRRIDCKEHVWRIVHCERRYH